MDVLTRHHRLVTAGVEVRRFNPAQPRDWRGRWTLTGAVIAALKAQGGEQGGAYFDDGRYFDWSTYDANEATYLFEVGGPNDDEAVQFALDDTDMQRLFSALSVTRLRDTRAGDESTDMAALATVGETDGVSFEDDGAYLDWSGRNVDGGYQFEVGDGENTVNFDLSPEEFQKLIASLALSTQTVGAVAAERNGLPADAATRHRSLVMLGVVRTMFDVDDDPWELDEVSAAIVDALEAFDDEERAAKPLRIPKGFEGGGRFRKLSDVIFKALKDWADGEGPDNPFDALKDSLSSDPKRRREQLRNAAKERGLTLRRGASENEIANALLDSVRKGKAGKGDDDAPDAKPKPAVKKAPAKKAPAKKAAPKRRTPAAKPELPDGSDIEVVSSTKELTGEQLVRGEHLTPAGRKALDSLGSAGHPRIAAISDTEGKIRESFRMLAMPGQGQDQYVPFTDLRKLIGDQVHRDEVDATLRRMGRMSGVSLSPQHYGRGNFATRMPAALKLGGEDVDQIHIDDPTLSRPSQFGAIAMAEELDARKAGRPGDPMMALIADADLQAEIDRRVANDPFVAKEMARRPRPDAPAPETAARDRQAAIDAARPFAETAAELDQILHDEASPAAVLARLDVAGRRHGIADELAPVRAAVERAREIEVENRIRAAYRVVMARSGRRHKSETGYTEWVGLADLRDELGEGINRHELDDALRRMNIEDPTINIVPESNQKMLTQADRDSAVRIGDQDRHAITIDDPADRPTDPDAPRREMAALLAAHGITPDAAAGDTVAFDRTVHEALPGTRLRDGQRVQVVRPGFTLDRDGERIRLSKAVVEEGGEAPSLPRTSDEAYEQARDVLSARPDGETANQGRQRELEAQRLIQMGRRMEEAEKARQLSDLQADLPAGTLTGAGALDAVPVQARVREGATMDSSTWTATGFDGLPKADRDAVQAVTRYLRTPGFANERLRSPGGDSPLDDRHIAALDRVMDQSRLSSPIVAFRGVGSGVEVPDDSMGFEWTDAGFVSTSVDRGTAEHSFAGSGLLLEMRVPEGTPALGLRGLGEGEVLLGRGLTFRVVGDRGRTSGGARHLVVEVVSPSGDEADPLSSLRALDAEAARDALDLKKVRELQDLIRQVNARDGVRLPVGGRKRELVDRLVGHVGGGGGDGGAAASVDGDFDRRLQTARKGRAATAATAYRFTGADTANADIFPDQAERIAVSDAFRSYKGIGSRRINKSLRSGDDPDGRVELMDRAFARSPLARDVVVWRGSGGSFEFGDPDSWPDDMAGQEWTDPAFVSATPDETRVHHDRVRMRIIAPTGTPAVHLRSPSRVELPESEILLGRGLRFRVVRDHGVVDGARRLDVEVVPVTAPELAEQQAAAAAADLGRPSGLPAKPTSADFDDLAERIGLIQRRGPVSQSAARESQILEMIQDLNASELKRLARKFGGGVGATGGSEGQRHGLVIPDGLTTDERRQWLAQRLAQQRWSWRSADMDDPETRDRVLALAQSRYADELRAAGKDVTPGNDELHHYWTRGKGLAKWKGSPKPWTTLVALLTRHVGPQKAKVFASRWFYEVFGFYAGSDLNRVTHGKPPRGKRVGPG